MPNIPYTPAINNMAINNAAPLVRRSTLGSGLRSLFGLGGTQNVAAASRGINWSSLLNNTSKTIGVVKEAIPIVKEVRPMFNNMRSMLKVASVFKDNTDIPTKESSANIKNTTNSSNNYSSNISQNEPNFFL